VELSKKRMMGLEPTTFCMARNGREPSGGDSERQTRTAPRLSLRLGGAARQQPTREPD
jgi:hypothetical protein